jgi:hypothetical protein
MPFTTMSANVLTEPYKAQYLNVYEKAHLLVCASISSEKKVMVQRILDLMQKLSIEYGVAKPFDDADLLQNNFLYLS